MFPEVDVSTHEEVGPIPDTKTRSGRGGDGGGSKVWLVCAPWGYYCQMTNARLKLVPATGPSRPNYSCVTRPHPAANQRFQEGADHLELNADPHVLPEHQ